MRLGIIGAVGAGLAVLAAVAVYDANRPYWNERSELTRVFAGSGLSLSAASNRGGNTLCLDGCPSLTMGLTSRPSGYGIFTTQLAAALARHGYSLKDGEFWVRNESGQVVKGPFNCTAPNRAHGSTKYWACEYNASGSQYHVYGSLELPGDTMPSHTYKYNDLVITYAMPDTAQIVEATITLVKNH